MATEQSVDKRAAHVRSVTVTSLAALSGVAAGVLSEAFAEAATDSIGLYIFVAAVLGQLGLLRALGVYEPDFSTKDYLFVGFMTFSLWFVTWTILLTTNTPIEL